MMWFDVGVGCESVVKSVIRISCGYDCDCIVVLVVWFCEMSVD